MLRVAHRDGIATTDRSLGSTQMTSGGASLFGWQLVNQSPMLLVYLVAFVLALIFLQRAPKPALLTLCGSTILLAVAVGGAVVQSLLISNGAMPTVLALTGLAAGCVRALATGLLVAAIFLGRSPAGADRYQTIAPDPSSRTGA